MNEPEGGPIQPSDPPQLEPQSFPQVQLPLPHLFPVQQIQQVQVWQGQFPPPDAIERYVAVQPDSFHRILVMAEKSQDATVTANMRAMELQASDTRRGQYLGASVTIGAIVGAVILGALGQQWIAGLLVSVPVLSVANVLIDSETARRLANRKSAEPEKPEEQPANQ